MGGLAGSHTLTARLVYGDVEKENADLVKFSEGVKNEDFVPNS